MAAPEEQPTTHEEIIGTCVDDETPEVAVAAWMKEQVEKEIQRFASMGHKSIALPVKNMGIVMDGQTCVNRVELDTNFDFSTSGCLLSGFCVLTHVRRQNKADSDCRTGGMPTQRRLQLFVCAADFHKSDSARHAVSVSAQPQEQVAALDFH
eukprot:TRINITY_DN5390_c0_g1_i1.p1 TRINITY_DN5390_c0_g1~~TRINITY_DN5390_c0_g1_i1.p1  ORF type:complete len:169 (-),score=29.48 TRINITY_DN5390_c0_g1_i1:95-550(-)